MKILLVWPEYPDTVWSFKNVFRIVRAKSLQPPLGLLTVAALLPQNWNFKVIDENVEILKCEHIEWADIVCLSGMLPQQRRMLRIIKEIKKFGEHLEIAKVRGRNRFILVSQQFYNDFRERSLKCL